MGYMYVIWLHSKSLLRCFHCLQRKSLIQYIYEIRRFDKQGPTLYEHKLADSVLNLGF